MEKTILKWTLKTGLEGVDRIRLAQVRDKWQVFCVYCNENCGSVKSVNVVSRLTTASFLRIAPPTDLVR